MRKNPLFCGLAGVVCLLVVFLSSRELPSPNSTKLTLSESGGEPSLSTASPSLIAQKVRADSEDRQAFLRKEIERACRAGTTDALYDVAHPALTEWLDTDFDAAIAALPEIRFPVSWDFDPITQPVVDRFSDWRGGEALATWVDGIDDASMLKLPVAIDAAAENAQWEPELARKWVESWIEKETPGAAMLAEAAAEKLAFQDAASAANWALSLESPDAMSAALRGVYGVWLDSDLDEAIAYATELVGERAALQYPEEADAVFGAIANYAALVDPTDLPNILSHIQHDGLRESIAAAVMPELTQSPSEDPNQPNLKNTP